MLISVTSVHFPKPVFANFVRSGPSAYRGPVRRGPRCPLPGGPGRRGRRHPRPPRSALGRASVPGARPRRCAAPEPPADTRRPRAGRGPAGWPARGARAARARGSRAGRRAGLGANFCGLEAGALRRTGGGEVSRDPGRRGRSSAGAVPPWHLLAPGQLKPGAPPREGGCEATDLPERPCSAAHCCALLARRWGCEPWGAGPLLRAPPAPAPGGPSFAADRPLRPVGSTLAPGTMGVQGKRDGFPREKSQS